MEVLSGDLFTNDILWLFVSSQSQKDRLAQLAIVGPLGKLDLGDQHGFEPVAALHDRRSYPESPTPLVFSAAS